VAYVGSKNPGGKLPGWGWAPGLRGYVKGSSPGGPLPGWGWAPNLRGVDRHLGSGLRKIVVGSLGCACKDKTLGQDVSDSLSLDPFALAASGLSLDPFGSGSGSLTSPDVAVPTGYGYGPSQGGGVALYPVSSAGSDGPYATPSDLVTGTPTTQYTQAQLATLWNQPDTPSSLTSGLGLSSLSSGDYVLIGGVILGVVLLSNTGKKRR
jgi:hypothetical protein